ncbi:hypothetical protein C2845_PM10G13420 [Panicum miliaceum]|uniref:Uncharacterized protein n=1 Tax=Panicum miliaceum TaxID=4540 RepID=A0A3L6PAT0_PANMI|nr:hypothetical protein C2845_PM10G13420 [Panicum miliaceum]
MHLYLFFFSHSFLSAQSKLLSLLLFFFFSRPSPVGPFLLFSFSFSNPAAQLNGPIRSSTLTFLPPTAGTRLSAPSSTLLSSSSILHRSHVSFLRRDARRAAALPLIPFSFLTPSLDRLCAVARVSLSFPAMHAYLTSRSSALSFARAAAFLFPGHSAPIKPRRSPALHPEPSSNPFLYSTPSHAAGSRTPEERRRPVSPPLRRLAVSLLLRRLQLSPEFHELVSIKLHSFPLSLSLCRNPNSSPEICFLPPP